VHDCTVVPVRFAHGSLPAQVAAGAQVGAPPPVEAAQSCGAVTDVQMGAPGAKQQAAMYPLPLSVQLCSVAPLRLPQALAVVAVAQVGGGGQVVVHAPPLVGQSTLQAAEPPVPVARQIDPPAGMQQVAMKPFGPSVQPVIVAPGYPAQALVAWAQVLGTQLPPVEPPLVDVPPPVMGGSVLVLPPLAGAPASIAVPPLHDMPPEMVAHIAPSDAVVIP
jgi:hypothetical protein